MSLEHCTIVNVNREDNEYVFVTDSTHYRYGTPLYLSPKDAHAFYQWCEDWLSHGTKAVWTQFITSDGVKLTIENVYNTYMECYVSTPKSEEFTLEIHDSDVEELYSQLEGK